MNTPVEIWAPAFLGFSPQQGVAFTDGDPKKGVAPEEAELKGAPKFTIKWLSNPANVFGWDGWCHLCETPVVANREQHLKDHLHELNTYLRKLKEAPSKKKVQEEVVVQAPLPSPPPAAVEHYTLPCQVCGNLIPKTGKRGRPPLTCEDCHK